MRGPQKDDVGETLIDQQCQRDENRLNDTIETVVGESIQVDINITC